MGRYGTGSRSNKSFSLLGDTARWGGVTGPCDIPWEGETGVPLRRAVIRDLGLIGFSGWVRVCVRVCGGSSGRGRLKHVRVFGKRRDLLGLSHDVSASSYLDAPFLFQTDHWQKNIKREKTTQPGSNPRSTSLSETEQKRRAGPGLKWCTVAGVRLLEGEGNWRAVCQAASQALCEVRTWGRPRAEIPLHCSFQKRRLQKKPQWQQGKKYPWTGPEAGHPPSPWLDRDHIQYHHSADA